MQRPAILLLLLLAGAAPQEPSLRDRIDAAVEALKIRDASVGIVVYSVQAGQAVYARNERTPLLLASNTKLLTTSAALARLGAGFRFRTSIGLLGDDLHVFAGGDPNISGRFHGDDPVAIFKEWAAKLRAAGVAKAGNLVLHTGIFDDVHLQPGWKDYDLWWWWSAPFGALSLNDNCVDLRVEPGDEGEPLRVKLAPDTDYVTLVNQAKTSAKPKRAFGFTRAPGTNTVTLRGEAASRGTYWVAVHDPTVYFGTVLKETLARSGIAVT